MSLVLLILHFTVESITTRSSLQRHTSQNKDIAAQGRLICSLCSTQFAQILTNEPLAVDGVQF